MCHIVQRKNNKSQKFNYILDGNLIFNAAYVRSIIKSKMKSFCSEVGTCYTCRLLEFITSWGVPHVLKSYNLIFTATGIQWWNGNEKRQGALPGELYAVLTFDVIVPSVFQSWLAINQLPDCLPV